MLAELPPLASLVQAAPVINVVQYDLAQPDARRWSLLTRPTALLTTPTGASARTPRARHERLERPVLGRSLPRQCTFSRTEDGPFFDAIDEYVAEVRATRKDGTGKVIAVHDSHGLCYDVKLDDGTTSSYEPSALRVERVK